MARYIDSGSGNREHTIGWWLENNLVSGIQGFRVQSGYYAYEALAPFSEALTEAIDCDFPVHIALGSDREGSLSSTDLEKTLALIQGKASASLTIVSYSNALYHPKTLHITRSDGSVTAVIGSGNLTLPGLGRNVEAAVIMDSREGDDADTLQEIAAATERWRTLTEQSIFAIQSQGDIDTLLLEGIIRKPEPPAQRTGGTTSAPRSQKLGTRPAIWTPARRARALHPVLDAVPAPAPVHTYVTPLRWCKRLLSSDAQQVQTNTNPTGKLRLSQAHHDIDHRTFFRRDFFAGLDWQTQTRNGRQVEEAISDFDVAISGVSLGKLPLQIDHAPHREAGQNNVPTVLSWGSDLGERLRMTSYINDWVVIERDTHGDFALTIQTDKPAWAP